MTTWSESIPNWPQSISSWPENVSPWPESIYVTGQKVYSWPESILLCRTYTSLARKYNSLVRKYTSFFEVYLLARKYISRIWRYTVYFLARISLTHRTPPYILARKSWPENKYTPHWPESISPWPENVLHNLRYILWPESIPQKFFSNKKIPHSKMSKTGGPNMEVYCILSGHN